MARRFIVYGVGAVGGVVAGALAVSGQTVIGVARGARQKALHTSGMTLINPAGRKHVAFECVRAASQIAFRPDDAILLTVKGQGTQAALDDLRTAGVTGQPVFCLQNGVANERTALRIFPNVHAVNVMLPCEYSTPDETIAWCSPNYGNFDIGRYPGGMDEADESLGQALTPGGIGGYPTDDVMPFKYGKLIMNLENIVEAALGRGVDDGTLAEVLLAEGRRVLDRAGIRWTAVDSTDPRRELMKSGEVPGKTRIGGSTSQSLVRGAGSVETDYLNGEIVLLGRLHGIATPANSFASDLAARLARDRCPQGSVSPGDFARGLGL